jgi:hypothetical protein
MVPHELDGIPNRLTLTFLRQLQVARLPQQGQVVGQAKVTEVVLLDEADWAQHQIKMMTRRIPDILFENEQGDLLWGCCPHPGDGSRTVYS